MEWTRESGMYWSGPYRAFGVGPLWELRWYNQYIGRYPTLAVAKQAAEDDPSQLGGPKHG